MVQTSFFLTKGLIPYPPWGWGGGSRNKRYKGNFGDFKRYKASKEPAAGGNLGDFKRPKGPPQAGNLGILSGIRGRQDGKDWDS